MTHENGMHCIAAVGENKVLLTSMFHLQVFNFDPKCWSKSDIYSST